MIERVAVANPVAAARRRYPQFRPYPFDPAYQQWMESVENATFVPPVEPDVLTRNGEPLFSVVIPMFNTPNRYLVELLSSLRAQTFENFEVVLADASDDQGAVQRIRSATAFDHRFVHLRLDDNGGISRNTNAGLAVASGRYVVFVDHDDTLAPQALNEVAAYLAAHSDTEIVYSDEDKITDDGRWRHSPFRKPPWSPHHQLCFNYTGHLSVVRRDLMDRVGGLDPEFDGAQDFDLILRLHTLSGERVVGHVPKVLYHWREAPGSTAADFDAKPYVGVAGRRCLARALADRGIEADVVPLPGRPGWCEPRVHVPPGTRVTVFCVGSAAGSGEVLLAQTDTSVFGVVRCVDVADLDRLPTTLASTDTDIDVVVYEPVSVETGDWLSRLVGAATLGDVVAVAPRTVTPDGVAIEVGGARDATGAPIGPGLSTRHTDDGHADWIRDVDEVISPVVVSRHTGAPSWDADGWTVLWSPVTVTLWQQPVRPRISVCVPLYRNAATVERCLRSVLAQDLTDVEVVVVDDASDDEGAAIARRLLRRNDRVEINPHRLGAAANHNRCTELAQGELVQFVHGDDELLPGALRVLAAQFVDDEIALAFAPRRVVDETGTQEVDEPLHTGFPRLAADNDADTLITDIAFRGVMKNWFGEPSSVMFRRADALRAGGFREDLAQIFDVDLWIHLSAGRRVAFVDQELSVRHDSTSTLSAANRADGKGWLDHTRVLWGVAMNDRIPSRARLFASLWLAVAQPSSAVDAVRGTEGDRLGRLSDVMILPFTEIERRKRLQRLGGR